MKSIDNLREWVDNNCCLSNAEVINDRLDAIEQEIDEMWHALTIDAKPMTDENMAESGWVRLPLDADGVPIHVGDVMELDSGAVEEVESMHYYGSGGWTTTTTHNATAMPSIIRHHHAPTVEDVLREFGKRWDDPAHYAKGELVETYAAKLRLAGEDE